MANFIRTKDRRFYVTKETTWGTAVAPTNSNAFRAISADIQATQPFEIRPDVNPTLSPVLGTAMRRSASFSGSASLAGSGAAGTAPDIGPILEAMFGLQTINASTSVVYSEADNNPPKAIDIWEYVSPSTGLQHAIIGAIPTQVKLTFGQNFATIDFSGEGLWAPDSVQIAGGLSDSGAGGLGSWPTEPASPVTNGSAAQGFKGAVTLDGNSYSILRSGSVTIASSRNLPKDLWGSDYPGSPIDDVRAITVELNAYEDDSSNLQTLWGKIFSGTVFNVSLGVGTVAGNIWTTLCKNLQVTSKPRFDLGQSKRAFTLTAAAHATSGTSKDAVSLTCT